MKQCPICKTKFKDTTTKCRYCNELLVTISQPKQKKHVKHPKKKNWQVKLQKIWSQYWYWVYIITVTVILIVGFQLISKNLDSDKKSDPLTNQPQTLEIKAPLATVEAEKSVQNSQTVDKTPDDTSSASDWNNKAVELWDQGKYTDPKKAIEYLNSAIKLQPDYDNLYYNRGIAYYDLGQYPQAIENFNEAIRIKSDYGNAYYNRGTTYLQMGNYSLACSDLQKACELGKCDQLENTKKNKICR